MKTRSPPTTPRDEAEINSDELAAHEHFRVYTFKDVLLEERIGYCKSRVPHPRRGTLSLSRSRPTERPDTPEAIKGFVPSSPSRTLIAQRRTPNFRAPPWRTAIPFRAATGKAAKMK
jgi:hypothetical protein